MRRHRDVVALIFGLLLSLLAGALLWLALIGPLNWSVIKIAAPLALTAAGALGLALSRNKP